MHGHSSWSTFGLHLVKGPWTMKTNILVTCTMEVVPWSRPTQNRPLTWDDFMVHSVNCPLVYSYWVGHNHFLSCISSLHLLVSIWNKSDVFEVEAIFEFAISLLHNKAYIFFSRIWRCLRWCSNIFCSVLFHAFEILVGVNLLWLCLRIGTLYIVNT